MLKNISNDLCEQLTSLVFSGKSDFYLLSDSEKRSLAIKIFKSYDVNTQWELFESQEYSIDKFIDLVTRKISRCDKDCDDILDFIIDGVVDFVVDDAQQLISRYSNQVSYEQDQYNRYHYYQCKSAVDCL